MVSALLSCPSSLTAWGILWFGIHPVRWGGVTESGFFVVVFLYYLFGTQLYQISIFLFIILHGCFRDSKK